MPLLQGAVEEIGVEMEPASTPAVCRSGNRLMAGMLQPGEEGKVHPAASGQAVAQVGAAGDSKQTIASVARVALVLHAGNALPTDPLEQGDGSVAQLRFERRLGSAGIAEEPRRLAKDPEAELGGRFAPAIEVDAVRVALVIGAGHQVEQLRCEPALLQPVNGSNQL